MKKRLMAFFLTVVTAVGSLPTAPVFADEDVTEEVVVEDAGSVSFDEADTLEVKVVSKNGAKVDIASEVTLSANETISVNLVLKGDDSISADGITFKTKVDFATADVATATSVAAVSKNGVIESEENVVITAGAKAGETNVTFEIVSGNGASLKAKATKTVKLIVTAEEEEADTPSENEVDPEVVAEAKKDAEGFTAFTSMIDIDPDAVNQTIYMVAKQSFQDDALKGFDYKNQEKPAKKADKKIVTISKKGKITAKKTAGTVVFTKTDNDVTYTLSVNVVVPQVPTKKAKLEVEGGKTITVPMTGLEKTPSVNVVFLSSDPTKASVSYDSAKREAYVTGIVKGKVNVIAYVNGKTYKTPVKVTSNAPLEGYVGYINKGVKNKAIKVTGVKAWKIVSGNAATFDAKGKKLTAGNEAGVVSVNGFDNKNCTGTPIVSGKIYVQDLDLKMAEGKTASVNGIDVNKGNDTLKNTTKESKKGANKTETYEITVKLDQKEGVKGGIKKGYAKLAFKDYAQDQPIVFKSSKATFAYMNGNLVIVAKKAYKKPITLTGKVNGKTIKIKVTVKDVD